MARCRRDAGATLATDDVAFEAGYGAEDLALLFFGDLELIQGCDQGFDRDVPVFFGDAEAGVGGFHVAAEVETGASGGVAEEVDDVLADALLAIDAEAFEEAAFLGVGGEAADEVVSDGGDGVVAAQA